MIYKYKNKKKFKTKLKIKKIQIKSVISMFISVWYSYIKSKMKEIVQRKDIEENDKWKEIF